ncbi:Wadjet anti-phage system protein JetD domain-containing protein [Vibrio campbellii]|uniref:Wadjet anti-phage system protein JetD domain-containing protein n=1 Tax=Vibrio campbellii TaxID=680 RepID=UPI001E6111E7|nr:Wadjet anti-phage system protein JetD domain-containing protein [Vibrio campbellii]MCC8256237.1 DUF2220 family protein [Vibrio campbellii CAIM 333]
MPFEHFYDQLVGTERIKVKFGLVREIYLQSHPEHQSSPDIDQLVTQAIYTLVAQGRCELPSANRRSNWSGPNNSIPSFIMVPANRKQSKAAASVRAWHPKIVPLVTGSQKITHPAALARLGQLSRWFAKTEGHQLMVIPLRERALEIFGDEKALDSKKDGVIYAVGEHVLTFEDIGAFYVAPPIPWEAPDGDYTILNGRPILFIENSNTYYSFARWNRQHKVYAAVAYAKGNQISASISDLSWIDENFPDSPLQYFGDLDPEGISIMQRANNTMKKGQSQSIIPARQLYWYLIHQGIRKTCSQDTKAVDAEQLVQGFGIDLTREIRALFRSGERIAQESLRLDVLWNMEPMELLGDWQSKIC